MQNTERGRNYLLSLIMRTQMVKNFKIHYGSEALSRLDGNRFQLSVSAVSTRLSSSEVIPPRRRMRRDFSMVMICSHLTSVKSVRPFSSDGAIRTCKGSSRSVRLIEATIVRG